MGYFQSSKIIIKLSFWIGILLICVSVALLLLIVFMRISLIVKERRRDKFSAIWRHVLLESLYSIPQELPEVNKANQVNFLLLWNHLQESLIGESKERLNMIARTVNMDIFLKKMLVKESVGQRLLAITALGHLRERSTWEDLKTIAEGEHTTLSLAAANALCKIDGNSAIAILLPLITKRKDWPIYRVAGILYELGPDKISNPLSESVLQLLPEEQPRLVRFLRFAHAEKALSVLRQLIQNSPSDEIISMCINLIGYFADKKDLDLIRGYLQHPQWFIRLQAVSALGNMGTHEDEKYLITRLEDKQWWVRYRAAQALSSFPFMSTIRLEQIKREQKDKYAQDILTQVIAERVT